MVIMSGSALRLFPAVGSYVALCIDPEATLEAIDDPELAKLTKEMADRPVLKYYAGYVVQVGCKWPAHIAVSVDGAWSSL